MNEVQTSFNQNCFGAQKQNSGLDIGNGRMSYIMLKVNALDERNGFNIRLEVASTP